MRSLTVMLVALGAMLIACTTSTSPSPGLTPTLVPPPTVTPGPAPTATATPVPSPAATHGPTPAATATPVPPATSNPSPKIVKIEFPDWVDESPRMAKYIASSAVIARARFVSVDSVVEEHEYWGHIVVMLYKFRIVEYLEGDGSGELTVGLESGPKYIAFPDWLDHRTEEEARRLARGLLNRSQAIFSNRGEGILFLGGNTQENDNYFTSSEHRPGRGGLPVIGETWLDQADDSTYRHNFSGEDGGAISLAELKARIEYMEPLMAGEFSTCVYWTLAQRDDVRSQIEGTYRELTLAGYREPEPFPRYSVTLDANKLNQAYASHWARIFDIRRPPYRTPRFSDYWLDGEDRDLFAIYEPYGSPDDPDVPFLDTIERVYTDRDLPEGEYSVHYGQYHHSLPCHRTGLSEGGWWTADTTELIVEVVAQEQPNR